MFNFYGKRTENSCTILPKSRRQSRRRFGIIYPEQKEPSRKTALFCKVPLDFVWQLCFMVKYCQDTRKLSMQKSMAAATRRQAIRYRNLKNPLKHTMATAAHTGDMPRVYI